jgi:hypothetical protein
MAAAGRSGKEMFADQNASAPEASSRSISALLWIPLSTIKADVRISFQANRSLNIDVERFQIAPFTPINEAPASSASGAPTRRELRPVHPTSSVASATSFFSWPLQHSDDQ